MKLTDLLFPNGILSNLKSTTKEGVLEEMAEAITREHSNYDKNEIATALIEREKLGSTGIDHGVAIPHAKIKDLDKIIIALGRSIKGIDFQAHDGKLSHLFFVLLAPDSSAGMHLKALARLSRLLKEETVRIKLMEAKTSEEMYNIIETEDDKLVC